MGLLKEAPTPSLWSLGVPGPLCRESSPPRQDSLPSLVIQVAWHLARAPGAWLCVHRKGCTVQGALPGHSGNMGRQPPLPFSPKDPRGRAHLQLGSRGGRKPALASQGPCFGAPRPRHPQCQELHHGLQSQGLGPPRHGGYRVGGTKASE